LSRCSNHPCCYPCMKNGSIEPRPAEWRNKRDQLSPTENIAAK